MSFRLKREAKKRLPPRCAPGTGPHPAAEERLWHCSTTIRTTIRPLSYNTHDGTACKHCIPHDGTTTACTECRVVQLRANFTPGDGLKRTGDDIDFEKLRQKRKTQTTPTHKKHPTNDTNSMTGRTTTPRHPGTQPPTKPESYRRACVNDHLQRGLKDRLQEYMDTGDD